MRVQVRVSLLALLVGTVLALVAPAAAQAAFGVEKFFAATCKAEFEDCAEGGLGEGPENPDKEESEEQGYSQSAGHPPFGITDFKVNTEVFENLGGEFQERPSGAAVQHIRTDVQAGLATNPEAVEKCTMAEFGTEEVVPGTGLYGAPACPPGSVLGTNKVLVYDEEAEVDIPLEGTVYNLEPPDGRASDFGVALNASLLIPGTFAHTLIEGNVEWQSDYHDYFEINVSPSLPLIESRLTFKGNIGKEGFLTLPSTCYPTTTTMITLESTAHEIAHGSYSTPIGVSGCPAVPFGPGLTLTPETSKSDEADGLTTTVTLPHNTNPEELDNSDVRTATVTLPEGMTLNPSAATGLKTCTHFVTSGVHSVPPGEFECPESSKIGTVTLQVPALPPNSLTGNVYLGGSEPITGPPYTIYVDAESARYGISVHLKGTVVTNETTGQVSATLSENPEQPFSEAILHMKGGPQAPIANPLACGTSKGTASYAAFSGALASALSQFSINNGAGGACPSPLPLKPAQSTQNSNAAAGGSTGFTFNLAREQGQQYISQIKTVLPEGLAGKIPAVKECPEAEANAGTCSAETEIGTATVSAGSGSQPYTFTGHVYFTGPYDGAPFGLSIVVPATAGPFSFGNVVTRASVGIEPESARVVVTSTLPRIFKGVPLRVRNITVAVTKSGFMVNPTNCGALATESTITGFVPGTSESSVDVASSPFQVSNCSALAFKPTFSAKTSAKASKANGASIETTLNLAAGDSNVKSVLVTLPIELPSRLSTLQKACLAATFEKNPYACPSGSFVGGARANTPLLPGKLVGPAVLVSYGGEAFPDLDLVLEDDGVRVILVGHTKITKGITTTNFSTLPDAPVTSVTVNLPIGSHSALALEKLNTNLCTSKLVMPTTITGQNGVVTKQNTIIKAVGCSVRVIKAKVVGDDAYVTVETFAAGRVSLSGPDLKTSYTHFKSAKKSVTLKTPLSHAGMARGRPFKVNLRVGFIAKNRSEGTSKAFTKVKFP